MRDYLYIPLGGNKVSEKRLYFNLWVVFLISGLWHGAQWTFILWGAYHGFFLAIERLFLLKITSKIGTFLRVLFTFFVVVIGWVLFRANDVSQATGVLGKMFSFSIGESSFSTHLIYIFILAVILSFLPLFRKKVSEAATAVQELSVKKSAVTVLIILVLLILCVGEITSSDFNPFIYFKF